MTTDDIGEFGQWACCQLLAQPCGRPDPIFRPRPLGDKYPTFDLIVEVADRPEFYFFVQVKATTLGYTADPRRLRVHLGQADVDRMVACPAPAYLVGVDLTAESTAYLLSVNEPRPNVASLTTRFPVTCAVLLELRDEVVAFWSARDTVLRGSRFTE